MASQIVMPRMGLTMEEGTVVAWRKAEGQKVTAGEILFEIETDKSTVEIEATEGGILGSILVKVGETVPVGTMIATLLAEGETLPAGRIPAIQQKALKPEIPGFKLDAAPEKLPALQGSKVKASPAARRAAKQLGVNLGQASGTGPGGRVVAWNIIALGGITPAKATPLAARAAADLSVDLAALQGSGPGGRITIQDVKSAGRKQDVRSETQGGRIRPFTRIEQVMARRMVESFTSAPHFYLHVTVDARPLVTLREQLMTKLENGSGVHLTYTDLLVYFSARTLAHHPEVMSQWTPDGMRLLNEVHIGVAVDTGRGLLVPVIRNADHLGLIETSHTLTDQTERARLGTLLPTEQEGGVFTISNLGGFGIDAFDAVLNPPQAATLAVGRIKEQAFVEGGRVIAASMLNLSMSVDHRVLDGATAARFLGDFAKLLETPALIMK